MGVACRGEYGLPKQLIFSMPVCCRKGERATIAKLAVGQSVLDELQHAAKQMESDRQHCLEAARTTDRINLCITSAANPLAYQLLAHFASGRVFGTYQPIGLRLLVEPSEDE